MDRCARNILPIIFDSRLICFLVKTAHMQCQSPHLPIKLAGAGVPNAEIKPLGVPFGVEVGAHAQFVVVSGHVDGLLQVPRFEARLELQHAVGLVDRRGGLVIGGRVQQPLRTRLAELRGETAMVS